MNTWVSFQSAEQPLLGQFSVSGNTVVEALKNLLPFHTPEHLLQSDPKKNGAEFELAAVIAVLPNISMEKGWVADYDYSFGGIGAEPKAFAKNSEGKKERLTDHILSDGTFDGFFQLALVELMRNQFYRWWLAMAL